MFHWIFYIPVISAHFHTRTNTKKVKVQKFYFILPRTISTCRRKDSICSHLIHFLKNWPWAGDIIYNSVYFSLSHLTAHNQAIVSARHYHVFSAEVFTELKCIFEGVSLSVAQPSRGRPGMIPGNLNDSYYTFCQHNMHVHTILYREKYKLQFSVCNSQCLFFIFYGFLFWNINELSIKSPRLKSFIN